MKTLFLILALLASASMVGCQAFSSNSFPPLALSASALGVASVTVSTPGWTRQVPVVVTPAVSAPTLVAPKGTIEALNATTATIATAANTAQAVVAIVESDSVSAPVLQTPPAASATPSPTK